MTTLTILAVAAVLAFAIAFLSIERRSRKLQYELDAERTRARFAIDRFELTKLVAAGKIDPKSDSFEYFRVVMTMFIHLRPFYVDVAKGMVAAQRVPSLDRNSPMGRLLDGTLEERQSWPDEMWDLVERFRQHLDQMCHDHHPRRQTLSGVEQLRIREAREQATLLADRQQAMPLHAIGA